MVKNSHTRLTNGRFWTIFILFALLFWLGLAGAKAQEPSLPLVPPNAETGLAIFADRCANCHGSTGGGDGELATQLPQPPAKLNDPEFRKTAVPATLFGSITNGIVQSGMPPFGPASSDPISDENRWNLIAAVYSFSTPADAIATGQTVYEENCLACHGESGLGDGPDAAADASLDLTNLSYWFNRSNETVLADVPGDIPKHDFTLSEAERWAVVDYARTFSYAYVAPPDPLAPIEGAVISGQVTNGATGDIVSGGVAQLRAFTASFEETLNITTTVGSDGRYRFDLPTAQSDWVFLVGVRYNDLGFSSAAAQLSPAAPLLDLPITVYEATSDPAAVTFDQIHLVMGFQDDLLQVSELYIINNQAPAVFVGETGDPELGTIQINLPDGAENPIFERTLGSMESTIPANEIIQTETGWADTLPLQPGPGGLNLIVTYLLPYEDGMTISHLLHYAANSVNIIMPDVGVSVAGEGWDFQGAREMPGGGGSFLSYTHTTLQAGDTLTMKLDGRPEASATVGGTAVASGNSTNELIIGGGILLVVIVAVAFMYRNWQIQPHLAAETLYDDFDDYDEEEDAATQLLQAIADLDTAHERGEISETDYTAQREQLKAELKTLWH